MKTNLFISVFFCILFSFVFMTCEKDEKANSIPVIQSVTLNPPSIHTNGTVSVQVVAVDADNDPLQYSYIVTGGAVTGIGNNITWTAPSIDGAHSITVTVNDGKGGVVSQNAGLIVLKPITQVTGTAAFKAGVSGNLENAKVSLYTSLENFELNQPVKFAAVNGNGGSVSFTIEDVLPGNYYLSVWKDNNNDSRIGNTDFIGIYGVINLGAYQFTELQLSEGQTFNCSIEMIIIHENSSPDIRSLEVNPSLVQPGEIANVTVQASDPENDPITYSYSVTGGSIIGEGSSVQWKAPDNPGTYTIRAIVEDDKGGYNSAEATLTVEGAQTRITGTAKFAPGLSGDLSNARVSLYKSLDDWLGNNPTFSGAVYGSGNSVQYTLTGFQPGNYYLDIWKDNDNSGDWSEGDYIGLYANDQGMILFNIAIGQTFVCNIEMVFL